MLAEKKRKQRVSRAGFERVIPRPRRQQLALDMLNIILWLSSEDVEITGVMEPEKQVYNQVSLLLLGDMRHGCSIGVFEEHSILLWSQPCRA
jgi:hypothetical protein